MNQAYFNSVFAKICIDSLLSLGVKHFVLSPGSRSTPLTAAIARNKNITQHVFHDERSAAFFALGLGKAGQLAAMITTSGTAVANAFPAIMEASTSYTPFLILSADRPPELRNTGANQTMDQQKLFGEHCRFFFDFPCPSAHFSANAIASTLSLAVSHATGANPGPVHLNCMFREPLEPVEVNIPSPKPRMFHSNRSSLSLAVQENIRELLSKATSPLLVIGYIDNSTERKAAFELAESLNWPAFVDISSGIKLQKISNQISMMELLLQEKESLKRPDLILHLGGAVTTKHFARWTSSLNVDYILVHPYAYRQDPTHSVTHHLRTSFSELFFIAEFQHSDLLPYFSSLNRKLNDVPIQNTLSEITVSRRIASFLPNNSILFIGNSMPIRDMNNFSYPENNIETFSNRGVSGIDGICSTAAGVSIARNSVTHLLIGDLSTMHDIGSLFALKTIDPKLRIIVINNSGGAIFSFLPISKESDIFEDYFATSHAFALAPIITAMGIPCRTIHSLDELESTLNEECTGLSILEIHTNRDSNTAEHQEIKALVHAILKEKE